MSARWARVAPARLKGSANLHNGSKESVGFACPPGLLSAAPHALTRFRFRLCGVSSDSPGSAQEREERIRHRCASDPQFATMHSFVME